ncbi:MAG: hypothetical protein OCC49_09525 [Fibrobacterales bacterium]
MQAVVEEISERLEKLYTLFQLALEVGESLIVGVDEDIVKHTDHRHRILNKTQALSKESKEAMDQALQSGTLSKAEEAFVAEKRARIFDLEPLLRRQNIKIQQNVAQRLAECRKKLAGNTTRVHAISAYMKAPQARPLIS